MAITKKVSQVSAQPGDQLTYTIDYVNNGPRDAKNVVIQDIIPTHLENITTTPAMVISGSMRTLTIPTLPAYATGSITIQAAIKTGVNQRDIITNVATIRTTDLESNYSNNYAKATTIIGDFANAYTTIDCPSVASLG